MTAPTTDNRQTLTMRTVWHESYGHPGDVLEIRDIPVPTPAEHEVLIEVAASSINALDWHYLTGTPMIARLSMGLSGPRRHVPGSDVSGKIVAVGASVTRFEVGDEVFGDIGGGGLAEYVVADERLLVARPANLDMEETATLGVAALTALQGLRDWGRLQPGQRVLINGGSGGVGTFAIQMARALGASHITAVCSTANVSTALQLGADQVIDYTEEDFSSSGEKFDVLFDNAGSWPLGSCRQLLEEDGTLAIITGRKGRWIAPIPRLVAGKIRSALWSQTIVNHTARQSTSDLETIKAWVESGQVRPVMDRRFSLDGAAAALDYMGTGHSRAKSVVIP